MLKRSTDHALEISGAPTKMFNNGFEKFSLSLTNFRQTLFSLIAKSTTAAPTSQPQRLVRTMLCVQKTQRLRNMNCCCGHLWIVNSMAFALHCIQLHSDFELAVLLFYYQIAFSIAHNSYEMKLWCNIGLQT